MHTAYHPPLCSSLCCSLWCMHSVALKGREEFTALLDPCLFSEWLEMRCSKSETRTTREKLRFSSGKSKQPKGKLFSLHVTRTDKRTSMHGCSKPWSGDFILNCIMRRSNFSRTRIQLLLLLWVPLARNCLELSMTDGRSRKRHPRKNRFQFK